MVLMTMCWWQCVDGDDYDNNDGDNDDTYVDDTVIMMMIIIGDNNGDIIYINNVDMHIIMFIYFVSH